KNTLFQYLQPALLAEVAGPVSSTTNRIEGGVNAPLRQMLLSHRGMRLARRKRAVEWWLQQHTDTPAPVHTFIEQQHYDPGVRTKPISEEPIGPALYDRAFPPEEGIGIQRGWKRLYPHQTRRARHTFLPITRFFATSLGQGKAPTEKL